MWVRYFKSLWFEWTCSRSACTLIRIKDHRQPLSWTSWLPSSTWQWIPKYKKIQDTTRIYNESQANSNMPLFGGRLLNYVDTSRTSICENKLRANRTFHSWYILLCNERLVIVIICADRTFHSWYILLCNERFVIVINLRPPSVTVTRQPNRCPIIKIKE
jgi:hypothetical protein